MIFQKRPELPLGEAGQSEFFRKIRDCAKSHWYYHRIELEQLRPEKNIHERIERLQQRRNHVRTTCCGALRESHPRT